MAQTVVGLFDEAPDAEAVVRELVRDGIPRSEISLVASKTLAPNIQVVNEGSVVSDAGTGAAVGSLAGLVAGFASLAIPGIGPVLAVGPLAAALTGAGVGAVAGGLVGVLRNAGMSDGEAEPYAEGVRRGGVLVTANVLEHQVETAARIMDQHGAVNIEKRTAEWRRDGWTPQHQYLPPKRPDAPVQTGRVRSEPGGARVFVW